MEMSPERRAALEAIAQIRVGNVAHRHLPWARHTLRIPEWDYYALVRLYPGLNALDPVERSAAWEQFEKSPFSEPYRIGRISKGVVRNGLILPTPSNRKEL
jgi:hypothetical protein